MKKTALIIICSLVLASCELITIGSRRSAAQRIELNQKTPLGTLFLFKVELDSNNIPAASQFIAEPEGGKLLAIQKYEMYPDIYMLQRQIMLKSVTAIRSDTLSPVAQRILIEFDYTHNITFSTEKIHDSWFITSYKY